MADEQMQRFDPTKQKEFINKTALDYMKIIEQKNFERVQKLKKIRLRNTLTGLTLGGIVLSIYGYSLIAVKQESFLDDFDPPEFITVSDKESN